MVNIAIYAVGLFVADTLLALGDFAGSREYDRLDYFYFSAQTFTALGYGDLIATENLRILLSIEPLNGLLDRVVRSIHLFRTFQSSEAGMRSRRRTLPVYCHAEVRF
jgi:ion channel